MSKQSSKYIGRKYPMSPPLGFSTVFTSYVHEHHENRVPRQKAQAALEYGNRIYSSFDSDLNCLRAVMLLLSDVPVDPLLSADQARKASVLGLTSLGFIANDKVYGPIAHRIIEKGDGIIILRLSGPYESPAYEIEVFEGRPVYSTHLSNLAELRPGQIVKNSTLL